MTELLKPCPFCGGEVEAVNVEWANGEPCWFVRHADDARMAVPVSKCPLEYGGHSTEAEAIEAWNTRVNDDGFLPMTEENMKAHGWIRKRTCIREKHGTKMDGSPRLRCSLCGYGIGDKRWNYCPNCGAEVER